MPLSSRSNVAKRPGLMFACVNLGLLMSGLYSLGNGVPRSVLIVSVPISLIGVNALLILIYRRATSAERDR